ncbi:class I SAM-dependent methyltransferase [uncultured Thiohalocapsa sp.]|uniref:class I SAM-dependent methyltransferase n=1 Tax=uncultured Thiohalocapsa sp. TaxID=768990 RepID=UPI0025D4D5BB|nr:class I SAM-dependent methyltransferase [uncultured Thiohalocapsa sp.]
MPRISVHDFYDHVLSHYGDTAEGLHYQSANSQQTRFRVLRELLPQTLGGLSLVDLGCGFGDFLIYLRAQGDEPGGYLGVDLHERMVAVARERTGAEIVQADVLTDPLPAADWYVCSGALNNLTLEETRVAVGRCYAAAGGGFVFNLLHGKDNSQTFNYRQPAEVEAWAAALGAEVTIVDGYLHRDFSAALVKPGA